MTKHTVSANADPHLDDTELLHFPDRARCMQSLEDHLTNAANLARCMWITIDNAKDVFHDDRDQHALMELAGHMADQASAALVAFLNERVAPRAPKGGAA